MNGSESQATTLGVRHALLVYSSPSALFRRIEDTGAYGWALVVLLGLVTLVGYVQVQTGLLDRLVDEGTNNRLRQIEDNRANLVERGQLRETMENARKQGEFFKTIKRLQVIVLSPVKMLAEYLLIAASLYAVVALTGRKPEYHTLMSICVYSGFIELIAYILRVCMMMYYGTINIDTSLALLADPGQGTVLAAFDPFLMWFWILVAMGLIVTQQLSRRMAIVSCSMLCIVTMGLRVGLSFAAVLGQA
ncbi:MAG: YIP1 family protein [Planctomycetes bacterium]|nr:YIP1 family protein [Planctomycetota bacterium]